MHDDKLPPAGAVFRSCDILLRPRLECKVLHLSCLYVCLSVCKLA